jgi:hypothetical protein
VLSEVLSWKYEPVLTEPLTDSGFVDYLPTIGERRGAMVRPMPTSKMDVPAFFAGLRISAAGEGVALKWAS